MTGQGARYIAHPCSRHVSCAGTTRETPRTLFADTINIADTVNVLTNERRLANPGTTLYHPDSRTSVFESGLRVQPGGFMSATHWNINAQAIRDLGGTFEIKGLTDAQTQELAGFLQGQLRDLYGDAYSYEDVVDEIHRDVIRDIAPVKKPSRWRMILAIAVAIAITVLTQGLDGGSALASAMGLNPAVFGPVLGAAMTAFATSISTQLITTGRVDWNAAFRAFSTALFTVNLTSLLNGFVGGLEFLQFDPGSIGQTVVNYGVRATVAGGIAAATGQGSFGQAFTGSIVSSLAADTANWIGDKFPATDRYNALGQLVEAGNPIGNIVAHAILGCATAAAQRQDCASGAIGGVAGELLAPVVGNLASGTFGLAAGSVGYRAAVQSVSSLAAGLITEALGYDGVSATGIANNAVANNFLVPRELSDRNRMARQCRDGSDEACTAVRALDALSIARQSAATTACQDGTVAQCSDMARTLAGSVNELREYQAQLQARASDPNLSAEERLAAGRQVVTVSNHILQAGLAYVTAEMELDQRARAEAAADPSKTYDPVHANAAYGVWSQLRGTEFAGAWQMGAGGSAQAGLSRIVGGVEAAGSLARGAWNLMTAGAASAGASARALWDSIFTPRPDPSTGGRYVGSLDGLTNAERAFVLEYVGYGKTVEIIPSTNAGRSPDFKIDGVPFELKTISGIVNISSDGLSSAISSRIMDGRGQSGNIIIDARTQAGMTADIAERAAARAFGADNRDGGKIQSITIITPQGTYYVPRKG